ncbi:Cbb3-type cytochrome oxidase component [Novosphingobium aromaticivorans DSM 12444]|uniref:Cbb3-type cytochrome oxidase component n=1 Tax=Novosphingobium aromaticivorans (strain ATCC 700278 / DSM 12444 / CCUG 56034 / CIP 105152 / NBRC 16084 / F199) TaxID=279238 RepID=Q2G561_NOVAD|nr:CcoQ/FixQ family Cbb3-type cytochrome c oxidase assembly chaperone [Novosphingobium aromaticivorans]ABD27012.1 Cbb3-type cytochrome oxidase component [Novosphingobium aromaticivorans DSM 12444]SCY47908.1 cytochrome c oxidase cbb3-type subunit 4 [Novosphingobium aromaticivorans]
MTAHSTYELLRHLADSWGLVVMAGIFLGLSLWPFRPGAKSLNHEVANSIFKDENDV